MQKFNVRLQSTVHKSGHMTGRLKPVSHHSWVICPASTCIVAMHAWSGSFDSTDMHGLLHHKDTRLVSCMALLTFIAQPPRGRLTKRSVFPCIMSFRGKAGRAGGKQGQRACWQQGGERRRLVCGWHQIMVPSSRFPTSILFVTIC